jgi:hypothetical protein
LRGADLRRIVFSRIVEAFERVVADLLRQLDRLFGSISFDVNLAI